MSLYHMYVAGFGPPEALIFRGTHLLFALTLVFLLYPLAPGGGAGWRVARLRAARSARGAFVLHIFVNYEYITNRIIYIDDLTRLRTRSMAVLAVLMVLEATRRVHRLGAADHRAACSWPTRCSSPTSSCRC